MRPVLTVYRPEHIGRALRELRNSQNVTIFDVANAMTGSTHATQITSWETGRVIPGSARLIDTLGVHDYVMVFMHKTKAGQLTDAYRAALALK